MADSIKDLLGKSGVLAHVILPREIDMLLSMLNDTGEGQAAGAGISTGRVVLNGDLSKSPIPGFDFALTAPTDVIQPAPYKIKLDPPEAPTAFQFWLAVADQEQVLFVFKFVKGIPGMALTGAKLTETEGGIVLEALPPGDPKHTPRLVSRSTERDAALGPALLIAGTASRPASLRFTPDTDSTEGIVAFGLEPSTVVFGSSQIGFDCPAIIIDDSAEAKADGQGAPTLNPPLDSISADTPSWRGILARELDFYLPASVPLFGGHPIKGYLAIPTGAGGAELVIETRVPARSDPARPGYSIRIECLDPTASGLSGLVPTLISATMELPLDQSTGNFIPQGGGSQDIVFAAGKPVKVTATFARDPVNAPDSFKITIGVSAQGQEGLISVTSNSMGGAKIFNTAATLATALIADKDIERNAKVGDNSGVVLYALLAAGTTLSSLFTDDSHFVLHGAEIESSGHGSPVGDAIVLTLDYSVAIRVTEVDIGVLSVSMNPDQPMRIRVRRARLSLDLKQSGLSMIGLDFDRAEMEIENPGAWNVDGLDNLFDVLGSRSGRGSSWIEVDLRFKLNLGPIRVSGATIRAALNRDGSIDASIRGLEAGLSIPGAVEGKGNLQLLPDGFTAALSAKLLPLNIAADAEIISKPPVADGEIISKPPMLVLRVGVDLPAPIPLANSGLGLFGIGGLLGFGAMPNYTGVEHPNPVMQQLKWKPTGSEAFTPVPGQSTFGLDAVVGTFPDLGFSFSARAGVLLSVPDVAVRGALNGRVLQPGVKMTDERVPDPDQLGVSFLGFIGIDSQALMFSLMGFVNLNPLLEINVPLAGYFPLKKDMDNWYLYLGADGSPDQGRDIGPISVRVLPDILGIEANAYFIMRGRGIKGWPYGRDLPQAPLTIDSGFVVAFGFEVQTTFGIKPVVWAELYASLDILIGSKPLTLAGFGRAGGSLNLGPFSLGVQAAISFMLREQQQYFWAEVTGRIELLFFEIEGSVTISFGESEPDLTVPDADQHPLDRLNSDNVRAGTLGSLTDDSYRVVAPLVENPDQITESMYVWPDTLVSLPFAIMPEIAGSAATQFPGVSSAGTPAAPVKIGSEMLFYRWRLDRLELWDVTDAPDQLTGGTKLPGELAASWQVPRSTSSGDVSELVLFSKSNSVWVNRVADGGANLPGTPLQIDPCHRTASAEMGWAIGFLAQLAKAGFHLPPESVSPNPLVSRVAANVHHYGATFSDQLISLDEVFTLRESYSLQPAQLVAWSPAAAVAGHEFAGLFVAPNLSWLEDGDIWELQAQDINAIGWQQITLDLVEPIADGILVIVFDAELFDLQEDGVGLRIHDDTGQNWNGEQVDPDPMPPLPDGTRVAVLRAPHRNPVNQIMISYPFGKPLGVVGIGGITSSARQAAAAKNEAFLKDIALLAEAEAAGPKTDPKINEAHQRTILEPGRLYRIDIDMVWSGEISRQDDTGQIAEIDSARRVDQTSYRPRGQNDGALTKRQLFFRTTPKPVVQSLVPVGDEDYIKQVRSRQNVFQPEMLERYLAGYEPAQSEQFRFCDDPVRAHFLQDHVPALALAYDFKLLVATRRVDRAGDDYRLPLFLAPEWTFGTNPAFLSDIDQIRYATALESECDVPTPGATASVLPPLEPEALYEVYVQAKAEDEDHNGRLPGVTFRTSRWRTPADMIAGLGFTVPGEAVAENVMMGDLLIQAVPALETIEGDDQSYQNALLALGLDGWSVATAPRLSRIWMSGPAGTWLLAGLMIESPEPLHRPDRVHVTGLTLERSAGPNVSFEICRRDRSGSRLLYLTATPVQPTPDPGGWSRLVFTAQGFLNKETTDMSGLLTLPISPAFSED